MLPATPPTTCPNLAVPAQVIGHLIDVESSGNRFAIGIVGARLAHQPTSLGEAVATVRMLNSRGYDYSLGITQVNRANLARYGLNTLREAFDPCLNMTAGSRILSKCYTQSGNDWGKAFSCYYSGNFVTGFHDGYVRKIYESIGRSIAVAGTRQATPPKNEGSSAIPARRRPPTGSAAYRIAIRSTAMDSLTNTLIETYAEKRNVLPAPVSRQHVATTAIGKASVIQSTAAVTKPTVPGVFVPRVTVIGAPAESARASPKERESSTSRSDHRARGRDNAFVF